MLVYHPHMRKVWTLGLGLLLACGGKAVIDGPPSGGGAGGTGGADGGGGTSLTVGGFGGVMCPRPEGVIVSGDGPTRVFPFAGPGEEVEFAFGSTFQGPGTEFETVKACNQQTSTNDCIRLSIPNPRQPASDGVRIELTNPQGIVFIGDFGYAEIYQLADPGGITTGYYEGEVFAGGGADTRYLFGDFAVCQLPGEATE